MDKVLEVIAERRRAFSAHPFLQRLRGDGTIEEVRNIVPRVAFFVLVFQDVLRLAYERSQDPDIRAIAKTHWLEDRGHDLWYLEDLEQLQVPLDVRWLFSQEHVVTRSVAYAQISAIIAATDDRARLASVLALEATGAECFSAMIQFLERMKYGGSLKYFARSHQHVEAEHEVFVGAGTQDRMSALYVHDGELPELLESVATIFTSMTRLLDDLEESSRTNRTRLAQQRSALQLASEAPTSRDPGQLDHASRDFGGIVRGDALAVVRPRCIEEVVKVVQSAAKRGMKLTPRGRGLSQSGQSVPKHGISLDLNGLDAVGEPDPETLSLRCGPGATWREVLEKAASVGLCPKVMPLNLDLSVGGSLSAGGLGTTSHRFGFAASNIRFADVVLGTGERVSCGPQRERAVYDTILGGLGRTGVLTSVELALRRAKPRTRTFFVRYDALDTMLADMVALAQRDDIDHLEALCSASVHGVRKGPEGRRPFAEWSFGLHVTIEYDETPPQAGGVLEGLRHQRLLGVEDDDLVAHAGRYDIRQQVMKATGAWSLPHPWFEVFLPIEAAKDVITEALDSLPLALGDGHRMVIVSDRDRPAAIALPSGSSALCFTVLPQGVPRAFEMPVMKALEHLHARCLEVGGKRYPSGWLFEMDAEAWRRHYGPAYDALLSNQRKYDPDGIFEACLRGLSSAEDDGSILGPR